jgi:hypothetical protein
MYAMPRSRIALALATALLLGLTTAPAMAAPKVAVGERINLLAGDQTFAASTPFHIDHGFGHEVGDRAVGLSDFVLDMDGVALTADFVQQFPAITRGFTVSRLWFYNFDSGLTGSHDFTLHYFFPCDNDSVPCGGQRKNTPVEGLTVDTTVSFVP